MLASRAPRDSLLNGERGLVGSAATLKNFPANPWNGLRHVDPGGEHGAQPVGELLTRLRGTRCAAAACSTWMWS